MQGGRSCQKAGALGRVTGKEVGTEETEVMGFMERAVFGERRTSEAAKQEELQEDVDADGMEVDSPPSRQPGVERRGQRGRRRRSEAGIPYHAAPRSQEHTLRHLRSPSRRAWPSSVRSWGAQLHAVLVRLTLFERGPSIISLHGKDSLPVRQAFCPNEPQIPRLSLALSYG